MYSYTSAKSPAQMQQPTSRYPQYDNPSSTNFQPSGQLQQNLGFYYLIPCPQGIPAIPQQFWPQSSTMIENPCSEGEYGYGRREVLGLTALQSSLSVTAQSNCNTVAASLQRGNGVNLTEERRQQDWYRYQALSLYIKIMMESPEWLLSTRRTESSWNTRSDVMWSLSILIDYQMTLSC